MESNGQTSDVHYFIYDGHGSTRILTDDNGNVTDSYSYDGYGNLLEKEGDTENDFLYTGEQYNYTTELYYLRARYMSPSTGTFISMDSYAGSLSDPVTLHKYLYANANPVMNSDPSGYMTASIQEEEVAAGIRAEGYSIEAYNAQVVLNIYRSLKTKLLTAEALHAAITVSFSYEVTVIISDVINNVITDSNAIEETQDKIDAYVIAYSKNNPDEDDIYTVYTLIDNDGNVRYVGRTKDYEKRMEAHARPGGKMEKYSLRRGKYYTDLSYEECRGLEQLLMASYHTLNKLRDASNPNVNFINGIGMSNLDVDDYYNAAVNYHNKYPTYFENQIQNEISNIMEDMNCWWDI